MIDFILNIAPAPVSFIMSVPQNLAGAGMDELSCVGSIDGLNDTFVFNGIPKIVINSGIIKKSTVEYTYNGSIIIFNPGFIPQSEDSIWGFGLKN